MLTKLDAFSLIRPIKITYLILYALNTQQELEGLVKWAERKKLDKAGNFYLRRLAHLAHKIKRLRRKFPWLYLVAKWLNRLSNWLSVRPIYTSGIAKRYRSWPEPKDKEKAEFQRWVKLTYNR